MNMHQNCLECGENINGRVDKKFCCDQCRNSFNNRERRDSNQLISRVNRILRKNRNILQLCSPEGKSKVHKTKLMNMGYNFNYFTGIYHTKSGHIYHFCYDFGFLSLANELYAIVIKNEYVENQ